jgi:hypothetical protein
MQSVKMPTLQEGQILVHDASHTIGQVVETICPVDNKLNGFEQVLLLHDGTRLKFRLVELRPATKAEARHFAG